jgi:hypothetical protein
MSSTLDKLILDHPRDIGETYTEHASHALTIGGKMLCSGIACLVHALLPGLFVRTASRTVEDIQALMESRTQALMDSRTQALMDSRTQALMNSRMAAVELSDEGNSQAPPLRRFQSDVAAGRTMMENPSN